MATDYKPTVSSLLARQQVKKKASLDAVRAVLAALGNPHLPLRCVHVTGTNGKGSVSTLMAETMRRAGYRAGLYTSPHLVDMRERIAVDGQPVSEADFCSCVDAVRAVETEPLTFFEAVTCAAFLHFRRAGVDCAVIEVGIGGRMDTTNVLESPLASVITSVAMDHANLLGPDIPSIAAEKAGIIKPGRPCFCGPLPEAAREQVCARAKETGSRLVFVEREEAFPIISMDWEMGAQEVMTPFGARHLALLGANQALNAALVRKVVEAIRPELPKLSDSALAEAMENVRVPGRFQVLRRGASMVMLDGAHNPEAAAALSATLSSAPFADKGLCVVLGMMKDKDYVAVIKALSPHLGRVIATAPASSRALDPMRLGDAVSAVNPMADIDVHSDLDTALESAFRFPYILVAGSFYLVGAALERLQKK